MKYSGLVIKQIISSGATAGVPHFAVLASADNCLQ
jgi:hypothetical protein